MVFANRLVLIFSSLFSRGGGVLIGLAGIITVAAYWTGLFGSFFFDDYPNIVANAGVKLTTLSAEALSEAWSSGISGQFGRPLSQLSFAINYYFSGFEPFAFKITNLLIHCLNGGLVYLLVREILDSLYGKIYSQYIGAVAALIAFAWLAHPIQLNAVLYVVQRMTSMSTFFILIALILHINARRHECIGFASICLFSLAWLFFWPLGILCKETAILFPGFVAVYELTVRRVEQGRLDFLGRIFLTLSIVVLLAVIPYLASPFGKWILQGYDIRSFSLPERLMTEPRILWEYIRWIIHPQLESFALFHDDIVVSKKLFDPWTTLPAILGIIALPCVAFVLRNRDPLAAFGIAWFLVGHALESTFIPLELAHEHRNYLALLGLFLLPVRSMSLVMSLPGWRRTLILAFIVAFILQLIFVTSLRANMYSNEKIRTQLEAQYHPNSARANYEAGRALARILEDDKGNQLLYVLAQKHFELAASLEPNYKLPFYAMIVLDCGHSEKINQQALDDLLMRFRERLILQDDRSVLMSVVEMSGAGLSCLDRDQVASLFEAYVSNRQISGAEKQIAYTMHADYLWLTKGDLAAARKALAKALSFSPNDSSLRLKWAQLDYIAGDRVAAKKELLELRGKRFSAGERETLEQLLRSLDRLDD